MYQECHNKVKRMLVKRSVVCAIPQACLSGTNPTTEHAPVTVTESDSSEGNAQIEENKRDEEDKGTELVIENGTKWDEHIPFIFYYPQ